MWYKNAIIYSLDVETFMDSDGDGIGDFRGLIGRIDHLENLGANCIWLHPFFPSPNLDDGYDVADYYNVDPRFGTLGDFAEFAHQVEQRGMRLILDLVVNHTSDQHPWFQDACRSPDSPYRDYYIWSENKPDDADQGMVFPGVQESTWTWSEEAGAYYFHRFFSHQPDLNIANPAVRDEILRIMGFWLRLGVSGFRVDAAPFLIEVQGRRDEQGDIQDEALYDFLTEMRNFVGWRSGDGILLAEANVPAEKIAAYYGQNSRMHMLFNFLVNQPLFLALARKHAGPLADALRSLPPIPNTAQWAQFLRNHDELDLGRLTDQERREVFDAFGPEPTMQIFGRGIRRRLAPMFQGDKRRIELAHSLIFSLPGTQILRYGDEIGMGEDLSLQGRDAIRTPMQWSDRPNAGFSSAPSDALVRPVIEDGPFGFRQVNVRRQLEDPESLLNRIHHIMRIRRSCPEIGSGDVEIVGSGQDGVFAHCCRWRDRQLLAIHNLSDQPCRVTLDPNPLEGQRLLHLLGDRHYAHSDGPLEISGYGYRWFRLDPAGDGAGR